MSSNKPLPDHCSKSPGVNKGVQEVRLDGRVLPGKQVALVDDRQDHLVEVILG